MMVCMDLHEPLTLWSVYQYTVTLLLVLALIRDNCGTTMCTVMRLVTECNVSI